MIYPFASFETGTPISNNTYLDDENYGKALDVFVKGCCDILIQNESTKEVLLVHRKREPQPSWWIIGGRCRPSISLEENVKNILKRETNLDASLNKISLLCFSHHIWGKRHQEPSNNGTSDMIATYLYKITPEEAMAITLDKTEYNDYKWYTINEIKENTSLHPAIHHTIKSLEVNDLYKLIYNDEKIANIVRDLIKVLY